MIKSPIQQLNKEHQDKALIVRIMADLMAIHKTFLDKHEELIKIVKTPGPKGEKPTIAELLSIIKPLVSEKTSEETLLSLIKPLIPQFENGKTPTEEELINLIIPLIPKIQEKQIIITDEHLDKISDKVSKKIKPIVSEKKSTGEIDIENLLSLIANRPKGKRLDMDFIDGLSQTIQSLSSQITSKGYIRGGGDVVKAGTNVSIAVDTNGNKVISVVGGGTWYEDEVPSGLKNGSNVTYTLAHTPASVVFLFLNGQRLISTTDYSRSGATITMVTAPLSTDILTATYS